VGPPAVIDVEPAGAGEVDLRGRRCSSHCVFTVESGANSQLLPIPKGAAVFSHWEGDCAGSGECRLDGTAGAAVTAVFRQPGFDLRVSTRGPGRLGLSSSGTRCGEDCIRFPPGAAVTVVARPIPEQSLRAWSGDCAGAGVSCPLVMDRDRQVGAEFDGPNVAFLTSGTIAPGELGGLAGADAYCRAHALDAGFHDPGFVAWLSGPEKSAAARVAGSRGWVRLDGRPFIDSLPGNVFYPLALDDRGSTPGFVCSVPTATYQDATARAGGHCGGWRDPTVWFHGGDCHSGTIGWTDLQNTDAEASIFHGCTTPRHLYCLQVGRSTPVTVPPPPAGARLFFTSDVAFTGNLGGLDGGDARCQAMATDAGLPGAYGAWLAGTAEASARFVKDGRPWYRPDGVKLGDGPALFEPEVLLEAAFNVTARRTHIYTRPIPAFAGAPSALSSDNCAGWTSASASLPEAIRHDPNYSNGLALDVTYPCNRPGVILCAQR
jgi:hypothetical protein